MRPSQVLRIVDEHASQIPVDVISLAKSLGITCHATVLDESLSGVLKKTPQDAYVISYNDKHPKTRQRFTIAHEIGHFLLHSDLIGDGIYDNCAYRSFESGGYLNSRIGPMEETEANKFAASILMPRALLTPYKKQEDVDINALAARFQVSPAAMEIRMRGL